MTNLVFFQDVKMEEDEKLKLAIAMSLAPDEEEVRKEPEKYQDYSEEALLSKAIAMSLAVDDKEDDNETVDNDDILLRQAIALSMQAFEEGDSLF